MHGYPNILCYETEVACLVSGCKEKLFGLYFSRTRSTGKLSDINSTVATILLIKTYQTDFYVTFYHVVFNLYKCVCFTVCKGKF